MDNLLSTFVTVTAATILVLVLAYASLWLMRRFQIGTGGGGEGEHSLKFLRTLPVGPRERISLVACNGKIYMLGIAAGGITQLDSWPDADTAEAEDPLET